jgi:hypothetical protein
MNTVVEWGKAVSTLSAGTVYEPWVQWFQFVLIVVGFGSIIAWLLTRRHVIACSQQFWLLLKRANCILEYICRHAPETERHRKRWAPYVQLVFHGFLAVVFACTVFVFIVALILGLSRMTWSASLMVSGFWIVAILLMRINSAAASWAWHSIKTGQAFTWPLPRS